MALKHLRHPDYLVLNFAQICPSGQLIILDSKLVLLAEGILVCQHDDGELRFGFGVGIGLTAKGKGL